MKILLADTLPDDAVARLEAAGDDVRVRPDLDADTLGSALDDAEILVVRSTRVTAAALTQGAALGLVVRAGAGTNTIDTAAAADLGIFVCNVPGRNAIAVAELTLGLILAVDRHIPAATADARAGRWNKKRYAAADGLHGRTLGIIGLGEIGLAVAERAGAFGMRVLAVDDPARPRARRERAERAGVGFVADRDELLGTADIVSLHVPGGPDTAGMVDAAFLAAMRPGAVLVNTARGDLVDEEALLAALDERGLRAGLDVLPDEPSGGEAALESRLAAHPSVVCTPHIGASTAQAQAAVADGTVEVIEAYRAGRPLHCVNLEATPARAATLTVRHLDRVGVLASVLSILRAADVNVSEMSNKVFARSNAAVATIDVASVPPATTLEEIRAATHVINVSMTLP